MRLPAVLFAAVLLTSCQTPSPKPAADVPLTPQTIGPAYADYVIETVDKDGDGTVTLVEWTSAGGSPRSFQKIDADRDGAVTRTELVRISSNARFLDLSVRAADVNNDKRLTPREFRSPSGVRVLRIDF